MQHNYTIELKWQGNLGSGTASYTAYSRDHLLQTGAKPALDCSADPHFRGAKNKYNPEELFLGAIAACHQL